MAAACLLIPLLVAKGVSPEAKKEPVLRTSYVRNGTEKPRSAVVHTISGFSASSHEGVNWAFVVLGKASPEGRFCSCNCELRVRRQSVGTK